MRYMRLFRYLRAFQSRAISSPKQITSDSKVDCVEVVPTPPPTVFELSTVTPLILALECPVLVVVLLKRIVMMSTR